MCFWGCNWHSCPCRARSSPRCCKRNCHREEGMGLVRLRWNQRMRHIVCTFCRYPSCVRSASLSLCSNHLASNAPGNMEDSVHPLHWKQSLRGKDYSLSHLPKKHQTGGQSWPHLYMRSCKLMSPSLPNLLDMQRRRLQSIGLHCPPSHSLSHSHSH